MHEILKFLFRPTMKRSNHAWRFLCLKIVSPWETKLRKTMNASNQIGTDDNPNNLPLCNLMAIEWGLNSLFYNTWKSSPLDTWELWTIRELWIFGEHCEISKALLLPLKSSMTRIIWQLNFPPLKVVNFWILSPSSQANNLLLLLSL